jgi:hypothetical protein
MHSAHSPSSQSGHQTSDGLEIWRIPHIPQTDGELDMMKSEIFNEIEELIKEMTEAIGKIRQSRETNSSAVREQKMEV